MSYLVGSAGANYGVYGPDARRGSLGALGAWQDDVNAKWAELRPLIVAAIETANRRESWSNATSYSRNLEALDRTKDKAINGEVPADRFEAAARGIYVGISRPIDSNASLFLGQMVEMIKNAPVDVARILGQAAGAAAKGADVNLGMTLTLAAVAAAVLGVAYVLRK